MAALTEFAVWVILAQLSLVVLRWRGRGYRSTTVAADVIVVGRDTSAISATRLDPTLFELKVVGRHTDGHI